MWPRPRPLKEQFVISMLICHIANQYTKVEVASFSHSSDIITATKNLNCSRDHNHAPFGGVVLFFWYSLPRVKICQPLMRYEWGHHNIKWVALRNHTPFRGMFPPNHVISISTPMHSVTLGLPWWSLAATLGASLVKFNYVWNVSIWHAQSTVCPEFSYSCGYAFSSSSYIKWAHSYLHLLPVHYRIQFKIPTLTYKTLATRQPPYLYNLLQVHLPSQVLHSSAQQLLQVIWEKLI